MNRDVIFVLEVLAGTDLGKGIDAMNGVIDAGLAQRLLAHINGSMANPQDEEAHRLRDLGRDARFIEALRRLRAVAMGHDCPCALYTGGSSDFPKREAALGRITIERESVEAHHTDWICRCTLCGARYKATEDIGWHQPTCHWHKII